MCFEEAWEGWRVVAKEQVDQEGTTTHQDLSIEELHLLKLRDECYEMVNTSSFFSGAVAAVPIPGVDIATDVSILMNLIPKINRKFGLSAEQIEALDPQLKELTLIAITKITFIFEKVNCLVERACRNKLFIM